MQQITDEMARSRNTFRKRLFGCMVALLAASWLAGFLLTQADLFLQWEFLSRGRGDGDYWSGSHIRGDAAGALKREPVWSYADFPLGLHCPTGLKGNLSFALSNVSAVGCFGEIPGFDYNPGSPNDLVELSGATVPLCLQACKRRNDQLSKRSSQLQVRSTVLPWCAAVVFNNYTKQCWLKRKGNISRSTSDVTSFVLHQHTLRMSRVMANRDRLREASLIFGVLSEIQFIHDRMVPALQTWLKFEHVLVMLEDGSIPVKERALRLLKPHLHSAENPLPVGTVRDTTFLKRDSLRDILNLNRTLPLYLNETTNKERAFVREQLRPYPIRWAAALHGNGEWDCVGDYQVPKYSGAWKNFPGVARLFDMYSNYSYYMIIDDDSYIIRRNLEIALATFYWRGANYLDPVLTAAHATASTLEDYEAARRVGMHPNNHAVDPQVIPIYAGVLSRWIQPISESRGTITPFIQGGAGIIVSAAAMRAVMPHLHECRLRCDYLPHGDVRLGCCYKHVVRVPAIFDTSLWHQHIYRAQGRDRRQILSLFPVSFHRMKNRSMILPLHRCAEDASRRMDHSNMASALPVTWADITQCYQWMRGTAEHEYKFNMSELH